ncbi:hypothetical protein [Nostoc sp. C117]|uniref:hypothetical protein n=1 Tax=Nostoc sp. C117 TaxID=3349875 RepID=UPI00370DC578
MKKLGTWLENIRPLKVLTVLLAGIFLFLAQACGAPGVAAQPPQSSIQAPNAERYDSTKNYPLSSPAGGMNNFSDVDPRARLDEKAASDRAEALVKNAKKNIEEKSVDSREQYVRNIQQGTPLGERVKNLGEDIGSSAEDLREGLVKGTQRGLENLKGNTQDATKNLERGAENAKSNIQQTADDAAESLKDTLK